MIFISTESLLSKIFLLAVLKKLNNRFTKYVIQTEKRISKPAFLKYLDFQETVFNEFASV